MRSAKVQGRAFHIRALPPCLSHQQHAGSDVPGIQAELPKRVVTPASNIREIDSGRSCPPHAVAEHRELIEEMDVHVLMPLPAGEAGCHQALLDSLSVRYPDALA